MDIASAFVTGFGMGIGGLAAFVVFAVVSDWVGARRRNKERR